MRVVYDLLSSRIKDEDDDAPAVFSLHENTTAAAFSLPEVTSLATKTSTRIRFTKNRDAGSSWTVASARSSSQKARTSKSVKRRADDILSWLSGNGCASEVKIRTAVGDTPDTSKALRLLVKKDEVKRMGAGGRSDPFSYMVACKREMEVACKMEMES